MSTLPQLSRRARRQVLSFATIGVASTLAYAVLYGALRVALAAPPANLAALAVTAVANTTANRRLTFEVRGRTGFVADQLAGLGAFLIALAITTGALGLLAAVAPRAGLMVELTVLVTASVIATIVRFLVLRSWMGRRHDVPERPRVAPEGVAR